MRKYLYKQQGVTLLELLATITISGIFITIIFSLVTSTFYQNDKTLAHVNLRQEANLIITEMRNKHQGVGQYDLCKNDLLPNNLVHFNDFNLFHQPTDCKNGIDRKISIPVKFTLADDKKNEYKIDTIIEGTIKVASLDDIEIDLPIVTDKDNFFDYLTKENIFVHGSSLGVFGSTSVNASNNLGTVFINNENHTDIIFSGNNNISTENIYIYKKGNNITFTSSTKLGNTNITKITRIEGNVLLNNGDAHINGETVYIDGNVAFNDSAKINAKKVIITGNVTFNNWSAQIKADEIYVGGNIINNSGSPTIISGQLIVNQNIDLGIVPPNLNPPVLTLFDENTYKSNGYNSRTSSRLESGDRIFSNGNFVASQHHTNKSNIVIISTGDIDIQNFGGSSFTGVLIAPYGKVSFAGASFTGVVIAADGFFTYQNPSITFSNISNFISGSEFIPFQ